MIVLLDPKLLLNNTMNSSVIEILREPYYENVQYIIIDESNWYNLNVAAYIVFSVYILICVISCTCCLNLNYSVINMLNSIYLILYLPSIGLQPLVTLYTFFSMLSNLINLSMLNYLVRITKKWNLEEEI